MGTERAAIVGGFTDRSAAISAANGCIRDLTSLDAETDRLAAANNDARHVMMQRSSAIHWIRPVGAGTTPAVIVSSTLTADAEPDDFLEEVRALFPDRVIVVTTELGVDRLEDSVGSWEEFIASADAADAISLPVRP